MNSKNRCCSGLEDIKYIIFSYILCGKKRCSMFGGFTLLEVLIVVALLAMVITLWTVNVRFLTRAMVKAEVDKLRAACRYMQYMAMINNKEYILTFDRKKNTYAYNNFTENLPKQVIFDVLPGIKGPPSGSKGLVNSAITFTHDRITFYPSGIVQSGTVYLTDASHQFLYALSCSVAQASYIRTYTYQGVWRLIS